MPPYDYTEQILTELKRRSVDSAGIQTNWTGLSSSNIERVGKKRNYMVERLGPKGIVAFPF